MTSCGIWLSRQRLVAVVVDDDGRASPATFATPDDEGRWALLEQVDAVHGLDWELVLSEDLLKSDTISRFALERGHGLWAAPWQLVEAIRRVTGLASGAPGRVAAMIARLAIVPGFRSYLRRVERCFCDHRQLPLL
jgi:hypothetical protein